MAVTTMAGRPQGAAHRCVPGDKRFWPKEYSRTLGVPSGVRFSGTSRHLEATVPTGNWGKSTQGTREDGSPKKV